MNLSSSDLAAVKVSAPGPHVHADGVTYDIWAPDHRALTVRIRPGGGADREIALERRDDGYFSGLDREGQAGDRYVFLFPDGSVAPDPASRFQPEGVHSWSECVDARAYAWRSAGWQRPRWSGQSIYEMHIGTFTEAGTFLAAIPRLEHLASLGVEAIELMPVADFPGQRNWGYDGVALFAPARCYGRPDDLRALIDAAHEAGLAVILDVVYNHLGPDGNYLGRFASAYFASGRHTPWGQAFDLSGPRSGPVREFFRANAAYWLDEFRVDGLRLDATHMIEDSSSRHLLAEIADVVHDRGGFVIAEDERNTSEVLVRPDGSGHHLDAVWADDFHHQVRVALTGVHDAYFKAYRGSGNDLVRTLEQGWFFTGQSFPHWQGRARGEACGHLPPSAFVHCIENHDQVGNRAKGERLEHLVGLAAYRAASALLCLSPYPPLLFMGQEWAASSPFLFFSDHAGLLGEQVSAGRQREFAAVGWNQGFTPAEVPDPQAKSTFESSKLVWSELRQFPHGSVLALYRDCLRQRREWLARLANDRANWSAFALERAIAIRYAGPGERARLVICSLQGDTRLALGADARTKAPAGTGWREALDSRSEMVRDHDSSRPVEALIFEQPGTVLLVATDESSVS